MKSNLTKMKNRIIGMAVGCSMLFTAAEAGMVTSYAEGENESGITVTQSALDAAMNLTELGTLDWMHIRGTTNVEQTSKMITTRKKTNTPQIQLEKLPDTTGTLSAGESKPSYTWTDGVSEDEEGHGSETTTAACVFTYKQGTPNISLDGAGAGCRITIPKYGTDRELTFVAGGFSSAREVLVYDIDDEDKAEPVYNSAPIDLTGGNTSSSFKYTVTIPAGKGVAAELRLLEKNHQAGNVFLGGIALTDNGSVLQQLIAKAESYNSALLREDLKVKLEEAIDLAKTADTEEELNAAAAGLQTVIEEVEESLKSGKPEFYEPYVDNWLYFGWENDGAKSLSTMGGAVYPGAANVMRFRDAKPVCYTVSVDGTEYVPDETSAKRRENTKWRQDGYLNSPISEWNAGETGVSVKIQHVPCRVLNDTATAVCTKVTLKNTTAAALDVKLNVSALQSVEVPLHDEPAETGENYEVYNVNIPANGEVSVDFAAKAVGNISTAQLKALGSFDERYAETKKYYEEMIAPQARPVSLPDEDVINSYLNSMIVMWETMVKTSNGDYEMRGSAGNRSFRTYGGVLQPMTGYDRCFAHDVPNMVEQFIRDGRFELAENIMNSSYYQNLYKDGVDGSSGNGGNLDAVPKYIIPYATLWQAADEAERSRFFTDDVKNTIKKVSKEIVKHMIGPNGVFEKSESLDNNPYDYLVVDNFTALHGFAAYEYLCKEWGDTTEAAWARTQMETLNSGLNAMLDETMARRNTDWYMCAMNDDSTFWTRHIGKHVIYDGNWLGSTFMMSTFPWDAVLKGYDLGGTWAEYLDRSLDNAIALKESRGDIPADSWGAWWGHEYGTVYNVGQCVPLLYSEKYRTRTVAAYEWLLDNQTAPYQWAESFDAPASEGDWSQAAIDYETWGLGFLRQGLLETFVSVKTSGDVIIGRGVPNEWTFSGVPLEWKNININGGKYFEDLKITAPDSKTITVTVEGDDADGAIMINLPALKNNIESATVGTIDNTTGTVTAPGSTKSVTITLKNAVEL